MARTLIGGGSVVSATGVTPIDVLIDGETISALCSPVRPPRSASPPTASSTRRESTSCPAVSTPTPTWSCRSAVRSASDTFETGTRRGVRRTRPPSSTSPCSATGENVIDSLSTWHGKADGNCAIDYGFHQIIGGVDSESLKAMEYLVDNEGITSFKLFMAYPGVFYSDDGQILQAMQVSARTGSLTMMHAENGPAIDVLVAQALQRGETAPYFHSLTRPVEMEAEATHRAIMLAKVAKAPLYVVHMSAKEAVETVSRARDMGANVFGETCPQYLYFSLEEHLMKPGFEGAAYVCSTPIRSRAEGHQEALWRYLRTNDLSVVATDHCPFCMKDQKDLGVGDFSKIPNGIGGVEHRMDTIYQGVVSGEIGLPRWVELCATTPARMFGLYPQKGVLLPAATPMSSCTTRTRKRRSASTTPIT